MDKYSRLYLITINIFYDLYKLFYNKNISWDDSYKNRKLYGYSDFIKIDLNKINKNSFIVFILIILLYNTLVKIQVLFFIYFFILFMFKKIFKISIKLSISKNVYKRILIEQPKFLAFIFCDKILKIKIPTREQIIYILLNINNMIIWWNMRFVINNSKIITKFILNLYKDPKLSFSIKYIDDRIKYLYYYEFDDNLSKFENTL
jgi:hypothetical protein